MTRETDDARKKRRRLARIVPQPYGSHMTILS